MIYLRIRKLYLKKQYIFFLLVILIWTQSILLDYFRAFLMKIPIISEFISPLIFLLFIITIILSWHYYKVTLKDLIFIFSLVLIFFIELLVYTKGEKYLDYYLFEFVIKILPLYFVGVSLINFEEKKSLIHILYILSIITLFADIFYRFTMQAPMSEVESLYWGDMDKAYNLLPHCCLIAYYSIKRTNIWNLISAIVGGIYLLMLGTRGAALIYILLILMLLVMGKNSKWAIVRLIIVFSVVYTFLRSSIYKTFLYWFYNKAKNLGLSVRIFDHILSRNAFTSSGRDTIRETLLVAIQKQPIIGYGLCADRVIAGSYAHNIVLELWVEFGVIVGTILFLSLVFVLFKGLHCAKEEEKALIISLIFGVFFKLFLSGSYLDNGLLFFLIGLCVGSIRNVNWEY